MQTARVVAGRCRDGSACRSGQLQGRIVGIAGRPAAIEGVRIEGGQRGTMLEARHQVGIGDPGAAEGHQVGQVALACLLRQRQVIAVVGDIDTLEEITQHLQVEAVLDLARAAGGAFDHVQVDQLVAVQLLHHIAEECLRIAVGDVVGRADGGEADAHAFAGDHRGDRVHHFQQQTGAVLDAAAVGVGTQVGLVAQELVQQVAVGGVDLDTVEAGLDGQLRRRLVLRNDARQFGQFQRARGDEGLEAGFGEGIAFRLDGRRGDRQGVLRLQVGMGDAADVPQLQEDVAALGMHGVGHLLPGGDLGLVVDAGGEGIALALRRDLGGLGDDEAGAGALGVVLGSQFAGNVAGLRAAAGQRGHDDTILQLDGAQLYGFEQVAALAGDGHVYPFLVCVGWGRYRRATLAIPWQRADVLECVFRGWPCWTARLAGKDQAVQSRIITAAGDGRIWAPRPMPGPFQGSEGTRSSQSPRRARASSRAWRLAPMACRARPGSSKSWVAPGQTVTTGARAWRMRSTRCSTRWQVVGDTSSSAPPSSTCTGRSSAGVRESNACRPQPGQNTRAAAKAGLPAARSAWRCITFSAVLAPLDQPCSMMRAGFTSWRAASQASAPSASSGRTVNSLTSSRSGAPWVWRPKPWATPRGPKLSTCRTRQPRAIQQAVQARWRWLSVSPSQGEGMPGATSVHWLLTRPEQSPARPCSITMAGCGPAPEGENRQPVRSVRPSAEGKRTVCAGGSGAVCAREGRDCTPTMKMARTKKSHRMCGGGVMLQRAGDVMAGKTVQRPVMRRRASSPSGARRLGACLLEQPAGQQGHRTTGGTLGGAALPGGTGDVQVGPGVLAGEALQEAGGGDAATRLAADVGDIGEVGLQLFLVDVLDGHAPGGVTGLAAGSQQRVGQLVVGGIFTGEQARVVMAQCHDAGAGEGGDIDHGGRLEAFHVGQGVAQDQAAFGIGVEHFDGLAGHRGDDVARLGGTARGHVFAGRDDTDDVQFQVQFGDGAEGAQHGSGAAHVVLHLVHVQAWLERDATGVEGDALAHQYHRCVLGLATHVLDDDELGRLVAAIGDRQEAAHLQGLQLLAVQHFHAQLELLGQLLGGVGQVGRGADVARQVAQVLGQGHAVGQCHGFGQRGLGGGTSRHRDQEGDLLDARGHRVLLAFEDVGAVVGVAAGQHHVADGPGQVAALDAIEGQGQGGVIAAQGGQGAYQGAAGGGKALVAEFFLGAQAQQHDAFGGNAGDATQQQGRARLARNIARLQRGADGAQLVQGTGGLGELAVFIDADHQCTGLDGGHGGFCVQCFCAKVHRSSFI
eukprot:TRINITY_DN435_c1_g1_i1.p1 TRINITY_DN435_c1_g1~~TRINITY_DN435_c1_g1_i1.p1  ORF type:complete len:1304 (+),score=494.29 TRINITY_DN435_c1_g1_i1:15351-19262(+)